MKKLYNFIPYRILKSAAAKKLLHTVMLLIISTPLLAQNSICVPASPYVNGNGITNVTIGTVNNTTELETNNYGDYSDQVVNIGQGVIQPFSITLNTLDAYTVKIWVDWNNNLAFDEDEEVYNGTSERSPMAELRGTFTVPATTTLGNHRLRIGGIVDWAGTPTPCSTDEFYTVFEDYTVNITTPPSCFIPINAVGLATAPGSAGLSWTAPAAGGLPAGYEYVVSTSSTLPTGNGIATNALTATVTIENNVFNYLHVRTNCGNGDYSQWITSAKFRYTLGDTCATAINLQTLISPYTFSTIGANDDYSNSCSDNTAPDIFYAIEVPLGYVFNLQQTDADYDSLHTIFYGNCTTGTTLECNGYGNSGIDWENTTGTTQTVYWVQYGYSNSGAFTLQWTLTPPPACNIPRNVTGTMTSLTTADIRWTVPVTGNPTEYEYAVTQSQTPPTLGTTITTNLSISGITTVGNVLNYVHVRTRCGVNEFSEWVTYTFYSGHCVPNSLYLNYYNITSFTTSNGTPDIANNVAQINPYTNNFDTMAVGQQPGNAFSYAVGVDDYTNVAIWVDWNNDLDFSDTGELMATHVYLGVNEIYTGSIIIPAATPPGNYRMRVRSRDARFGNPCAVYDYGTAQDYAITVGNPPTCFNPVNVTGTASATGTAILSWSPQNAGNTPVGYEYAVSTSADIPDAVMTTTSTTVENYPVLTDGTNYYLHVRTNCGNGDYSQWVTSVKFRYLEGDTCESAINLTSFTSPYSSTTEGAADDYTPVCGSNTYAPDMVYYIEVPNGYTLITELVTSNYNSNYSIFYGDCINQSPIACLLSGGFPVPWQNLTGNTQNVYWIQDGGGTDAGEFTISWSFLPPPPCDIPLDLAVNSTSLTSAAVSWELPNTGTPAGYDYAVTQSETPPENIVFTTELSATVNNVVANATNYLHVRSNCGETDGVSDWVKIPFFSGYCVPENTDENYYITSIRTTGAQTNFTSANTNFSAYTDYTTQHSVTSYPGGSFNVQATAPVATNAYLYSVFVDWNNDYDFTDAGERVVNTATLTSPANLGSVIVPSQIPLGSYRMRIRNLFVGSPVNSCGPGLGEAEDYILNVVATPSCLPPFNLSVTPTDIGYANLNWSPPQLGGVPTGYEYVFSPVASAPAPGVSGTFTASFFVSDVQYDPAQSVYLFVRSICGEGDFSSWTAPASILGTTTPELLSNSVIVYKENSTINITSGNIVMKGVTIYDTRGRKLYSQADINNTHAEITGLQLQQQVLIVEVTTTAGQVSKKIVY